MCNTRAQKVATRGWQLLQESAGQILAGYVTNLGIGTFRTSFVRIVPKRVENRGFWELSKQFLSL